MIPAYIRKMTISSLAGLLLIPAVSAWGISYRYDTLNRLVSVSYDNGMSIDYSYDASGNILRIERAGAGADLTAPTVTDFTLPASSGALTIDVTSFAATDNLGVTGYCIAATDSSSGCSWSASAPASYSFPQGTANGNRTLYAFAKDAAGNVSPSRPAALSLNLPRLSVTIATVKSGSGSVNSAPSGIACVSGDTRGCSVTFNAGTDVTLIPLGADSIFLGWSGACTNSSGNCLVTMNASKSATATFSSDAAKALIEGSTTPYYSIGTVLDAVTAAGQTVRARNLPFTENVIKTNNLPTRLVGGYTDTALKTRSSTSFTTVDGSVRLRRGTLRVDHLKIK